jgi:hypothetical protein
MKKTPADIALTFIDQINSHDVPGLAMLMTDDILFIDGLGQVVRGKRRLEQGWRAYFTWFPDYSIVVEETFSRGPSIALFGSKAPTRWVESSCWKITGESLLHGRLRFATNTSPSGAFLPTTSQSGKLCASSASDRSFRTFSAHLLSHTVVQVR